MNHTTQLGQGWISISDGDPDDESTVTFRRSSWHHTHSKPNPIFEKEIKIKYHLIRDFFAQQIGYDLESLFEDVDAAGIIDRLVEANRKPQKFCPGANLPKDETYSLGPVEDGTTLKEILAVLEDIHSTLCEPDV